MTARTYLYIKELLVAESNDIPAYGSKINKINTMKNYNEFKDWGKLGGKQKGINYQKTRNQLLEEVSKQVDKKMLNMIQSKFSNNDIVRLIKAWENK